MLLVLCFFLCFFLSTASSALNDNSDRNQQQAEESDYKFVSDQLDKNTPKSPVTISQSTLLSSPRPPEHHL